MTRRKPVAVLATVAAALAVALPASASAATSVPTVPSIGGGSSLLQSQVCPLLISQLQIAETIGNAQLLSLTSNLLFDLGCGGPAI
ncbi:MAG: hypothetical protein QOI27_1819 [Gaiellaceae bacterium]|jgi:hypothetical protein|nr:hypothetical protein [Gaiellaceae bacterium]MDX6471330.1 hypothetical protein [Gaiellaceae bacterium]